MEFIDNLNNGLPLLDHPLDSESEFTPQALIEAVRARRNLVSVALPEVCIQEFNGYLTDQRVQSGAVSFWRSWA